MHDPLQTQSSLNPFGLPFSGVQTGINATAFNPLAGIAQTGGSPFGQQGYQGIQQGYGAAGSNIGAIAQQQQQLQQLQQLASILASQGALQPELFGVSQLSGWQNPGQSNLFPNPLLMQQNPLQQLMQQNQLQQLAQQNPFTQQLNPYGQHNPFQQQNPYAQNSLLQTSLMNPVLAQQLAMQAAAAQQFGQYGQSPYGQQQYGQNWPQLGQIGGYQLAPQSWIGQGAGQFAGGQQIPGQMHSHHLAQLAARGLI